MGILSDIGSKLGMTRGGTNAAPSYQLMMQVLSEVRLPTGERQDIVSRGLVRNLRCEETTRVFMELIIDSDLTLAETKQLVAQCEAALKTLPHVQTVEVRPLPASGGSKSAPTPHKTQTPTSVAGAPKKDPLAKVQQIIAVASGKGGVAKSTTAVNLAFSLAAEGAKVGLLDADVYGPSVSQMTGSPTPQGMRDQLIIPPEKNGVKLMSVAMFTPPEKAQILRGPMAGNLVKQLLTQTAWGELDYLIIDYPPGTGDIQLTISQAAAVSGAVIVTTPQELALLDVRKALAMFETMKVPILSVIETMSYFVCDNCDKKHQLFREGGGRRLSSQHGVPLLGEIPLDPRVGISSDAGEPLVLAKDGGLVADAYRAAAMNVAREMRNVREAASGALGSFTLNWWS